MSKRIKTLQRALNRASSYSSWRQIATELDQLSGASRWRADDHSPVLASAALRADIAEIRRLQETNDLPRLAQTLHASIYRHQVDLISPGLYQVALTGTKHIVDEFYACIASALAHFIHTEHPQLGRERKIELLEDARLNLGQPALLLSGGASMGFFHLGVVKAMLDAELLPRVICGSSIGSLIAAGVCTRNDAELSELLTDLESIYRYGIRFLRPDHAWRQRAALDQKQYARCVRENVPDMSFAEAAAHSGRDLCISVSPARVRQKPRLLSARSSPNVLIEQAVVASSAIPAMFPPVTLKQRNARGQSVPYLPAERWVDGTFQGDLPTNRLARLYNVNHAIASQVNPHAIPFMVSRNSRGFAALAADLTMSSARVQLAQSLKVLQSRTRNDTLFHLVEHTRLVAEQNYRGDTCIHPPISPWMYRRMLSNPSVDDLRHYIQMGERATWPKLNLIRNQTRIQRKLDLALKALRQIPAAVKRRA